MSIQDSWNEYRRVYTEPMGPVQEKELRQAFYAGFWMALGELSKASVLPEDDAVKILQSWHAEAEIFLMPKSKG